MAQHVDVGIITIREDELDALQRRLPASEVVSGQREYNVSRLQTADGDHYTVAVVRCLEQGNGEAQAAARDLLEDLDPQWLLVVGIAGAVPGEAALGDVVVSTRIFDFSVEAVTADGGREYALAGGPIHPGAAKVVANLPARRAALGDWNSAASIGVARPSVEVHDDALYGDAAWRRRVTAALATQPARDPTFTTAAIASSDRLVKNADLAAAWLGAARQIRAIEMEAAGVYRAAWARGVPAIAIRGISDVVGFKRNDAWTRYACESAGAFTLAFLRLTPFPSRARRERATPPAVPADPATSRLHTQLTDARSRKERLRSGHQDTAAVEREIIQLRHELRAGGQLRAGDELVDGRYLLVTRVGGGGFAVVWRAFDRERGCPVAVKVLHANLAGDRTNVDRLFRGARIMAELDHPSIVRVLDRGGHDLGFEYFVMEFLEGGNLRGAVADKRVSRPEVMAAIFAVADALATAHARGLVHRDVKPENILLAADLSAHLADFDLVNDNKSTGGTRTGALGTYVYAAPEQLERPQDVDARADVHGLGMTLVFALHGGALSANATRNLDRFIDRLDGSPELKALLKRSVAAEPADRFTGAAAMGLALSALPEVRADFDALCTASSYHLLAPIVRFHERTSLAHPVAAIIAVLRDHHAARAAEAAGDLEEAAARYRGALTAVPGHVPTLAAYRDLLARTGDDAARAAIAVRYDTAVEIAAAARRSPPPTSDDVRPAPSRGPNWYSTLLLVATIAVALVMLVTARPGVLLVPDDPAMGVMAKIPGDFLRRKFEAPYCDLERTGRVGMCSYGTLGGCLWEVGGLRASVQCIRRPARLYCVRTEAREIGAAYSTHCYVKREDCEGDGNCVRLPLHPPTRPPPPDPPPTTDELARIVEDNGYPACAFERSRRLIFCIHHSLEACVREHPGGADGQTYCTARPSKLFCTPRGLTNGDQRVLSCFPDAASCARNAMDASTCLDVASHRYLRRRKS